MHRNEHTKKKTGRRSNTNQRRSRVSTVRAAGKLVTHVSTFVYLKRTHRHVSLHSWGHVQERQARGTCAPSACRKRMSTVLFSSMSVKSSWNGCSDTTSHEINPSQNRPAPTTSLLFFKCWFELLNWHGRPAVWSNLTAWATFYNHIVILSPLCMACYSATCDHVM